MGKASAISTHPEQEAIDEALALGEVSLQALATRFNVSPYALSRRRKRLAITPAVEADDLPAQALKWRERADQLWRQGTADADSRAMAQAVSAGLRSVELQARQKERDQEIAAEENDDDRVSIGDLDSVISLFDAAPPDPVNQVKLKIALDKARAVNRMDGVAIFFKMLEDSAFAADLTDFATTWKQEEKVDEPVQAQTSASN